MTFSHQWLFHGNITLRPPYSLVCGSALKNLGSGPLGFGCSFHLISGHAGFKEISQHMSTCDMALVRVLPDGSTVVSGMKPWCLGIEATLLPHSATIVLLIVGIQLCTLLLPSNLPPISHGAIGIWWLEEVRGIWCRGHQRWGQGLHTCIFLFLIWTIQDLQEGARCTHENHIFQNTLVPGAHG